jgi:hypothetical protein
MIFSRPKTLRDHSWSTLEWWLTITDDELRCLAEKRRLAMIEARERGNEDLRPSRGVMSPAEAWTQVCEVISIRENLMRWGWLPPREKDVRERTGNEGGTLLAGFPTKWALNRSYTLEDIWAGARNHFID